MIKKIRNTLFFTLLYSICFAQSVVDELSPKWSIETDYNIIKDCTQPENLPYQDNIEMSGKRVAAIVHYDVDTNQVLSLKRQVFFPQLHPYIREDQPDWYIYRAYLQDTYTDDILPKIYISRRQFVPGKLKNIRLDGNLHFEHAASKLGLALERTLFPSTEERLFIEEWTLKNTTDSTLELTSSTSQIESSSLGALGLFSQMVETDIPTKFSLPKGAEKKIQIQIKAKHEEEDYSVIFQDDEIKKRNELLDELEKSLILETPNNTLNTLFNFAKIRASESIFESKLGLIHSPGGGRYYVGIWANDQAEYVSPFFPYLGYEIGNESAVNCYRAFANEINEKYEAIRYAFEIEGMVPPFLLDRGDAAMIAYGASQFVLATGDKTVGASFWELIAWCLEYCHRQLNEAGVVQSESDEMEGRIETGTANLATSSLYYGALGLAIDLGKSLGKSEALIHQYERNRTALKLSIENYFGDTVEGLITYKYYDEHQYLRHWICLPLVVGIFERKEGTIKALFEKLWSENGVHVEKNPDNAEISKIFWDRGTLYALRGTFLAGATEQSLEKLLEYSEERLLGARVPYPVEAYPEGNKAHLSAESALYCRIFTEGLFGIIPTGFNSFICTPRLPEDWAFMNLKRVKSFGEDYDIKVERESASLKVSIYDHKRGKLFLEKVIKEGELLSVSFP